MDGAGFTGTAAADHRLSAEAANQLSCEKKLGHRTRPPSIGELVLVNARVDTVEQIIRDQLRNDVRNHNVAVLVLPQVFAVSPHRAQ